MDNKAQNIQQNIINKKLNNIFLSYSTKANNNIRRIVYNGLVMLFACIMYHIHFWGGNIKILFYGERGSHKQLLYSILI